MIGAGVYERECTQAFESTRAQTCILMVINGREGHGFSVITTEELHVPALPDLLRLTADMIEKEQKAAGN